MSSRSFSFLKRLKTEKTERGHLNGWKPSNKTPSSRIQHSSRSPAHRDFCQKIQLRQKDHYLVKCANHPLKKGLFEPKQSLKQAYCQDCSIKMVKHNVRMMRVTEQSLYLRTLYEAQIDRLFSYEQQVKQLVGNYFESQRELIKMNLLRAKQMSQKIISIPIFKPEAKDWNDLQIKMKEAIGHVHMKKIELINRTEKIQSHSRKQTKQATNNMQICYDRCSFDNNDKQNQDSQNTKLSLIEAQKKRVKGKDAHRLISLR